MTSVRESYTEQHNGAINLCKHCNILCITGNG